MTAEDPEAAAKPGAFRLLVAAGIGLGLLLFLILGWCALRREPAAPEPDQFKRRVNAMVKDLIRDHWEAMRKAVEQLRTDEGAKAFFEANPGLTPRIPSASAFVALAHSWRPLLRPLPEALPGLETHDLSFVKNAEGEELSYRTDQGAQIYMRWSGDRLVEMRVY